MRTALLLTALAVGATALAPSADAQRRAKRDTTDRVERRADDRPRSRQDRRPRFRSEGEALDHARRTREARRGTTERARPRRDRAGREGVQRPRSGYVPYLDTLAVQRGGAAASEAGPPRNRQQVRRQRRGGPPGRDISNMQDIVPGTAQDGRPARPARRPGDAPPDEGGFIIDDWIWGAQDADREPRPEADGQAARTQSRPRAAGTTTVSGRRIGQNPAGPGAAPPAAGDYDRADLPDDTRSNSYEYGIGYVATGEITSTSISGLAGDHVIEKSPGNGAVLISIEGYEKEDAPCAFMTGWARRNDERLGRQGEFETMADQCKDGYNDRSSEVAYIPTLDLYAEPPPLRAIHAVQVCMNGRRDRIKGVRVWGAHVGRNVAGEVEPDRALYGEYARANCSGDWERKVTCPSDQVAVGLTIHGDGYDPFGRPVMNEARGISLECSALHPVEYPRNRVETD